MSNSDDGTKFLLRVIDTLFINNPKGTAAGVLYGWSFHVLSKAFQGFFISKGFDPSVINLFECCIVGITIINTPYFFKKPLREDAQEVLDNIKLIKASSLSKEEKNYRQRKALEDYSRSVFLKNDQQEQLALARKKTTPKGKESSP